MTDTSARIWDHIVVGAGSSGCVVAERLSAKSSAQVLVIESGGENANPFVTMPRGFGRLNGQRTYNWIYKSAPTGGANRAEYWLRGRGLGGSGAVNGSVYVRGLPGDFDDWDRLGCTGWAWSQMERHFLAVEQGDENRPSLGVTPHPGGNPFCDAAMAAAKGLGVAKVQDLNQVREAAIGYQPRSILRGRRRSAANTFLRTARKRQNVRVMTTTDTLRVLFDGTRVTGVEIRQNNSEKQVLQARNVVLCAGALNTPKILMHSGIGGADSLRALGVSVVADAPEVGENLREHRLLSLQFRLSGGSQNWAFSGAGLALSVARYYLLRTGPLAQSAFEVGGFIATGADPLDSLRPDAQIGLAPISMDKTTLKMKPEDAPGALCGGYAMRPQSQGRLALTAPDWDAPLDIRPNYLDAEIDQRVSLGVTRFVRAMFAHRELARFDPVETFPGPDVAQDDEILDAFHQKGQAGFHAAGTCRMGNDLRSVVDPETRVRGVCGLNIADISIMPRLVSGNTNAPAMAMAHRAAELIGAQEANT